MQEIDTVSERVMADASAEVHEGSRAWWVGLTSFLFILLQSLCTAVMAVSGIRLAIGLGSLAAAAWVPRLAEQFHANAIRVPMMVIAVGGALVNLYVIWRIRSLRGRSSSQWRARPVDAKQRRDETVQIVLAVLTLLLVGAEWIAHNILFGAA